MRREILFDLGKVYPIESLVVYVRTSGIIKYTVPVFFQTGICMKIALFEGPSGDRPLAALVLLLTGVFALALQDSLVKFMSSQTSFWQFQTLRSVGNLGFTVMLAAATGGIGLLIPKKPGPVVLRASFLMICMFCFFAGAPFFP